jgi:peptidyl-prolyl cis-trans isomerase C
VEIPVVDSAEPGDTPADSAKTAATRSATAFTRPSLVDSMKNTTTLLPGLATVLGLGLMPLAITAQDAPPAPKSPEAPAATAAPAAPAAPGAPGEAPAERPQLKETDIVLEVDGTPITVLDVRELFTARYGRQFESMPAEQRAMIEPQIQQMVMNELIQKTLLTNAADKEGMKATPEEVESSLKEIAAQIPEGASLEEFAKTAGVSLDRIRQQISTDTKVRKLYEKVTADVAAPAEADVKKYFDEHPEEFEQKASVDAAHILISTQGIEDPAQLAAKEKIAKELRAELVAKKGENFAEMAGLHSDCPSKAQGGDLGEFEKGQMVPEFEKAAFAQEVGVIGETIKTDFGYHIIKVNGKKEAKTLVFADVKEDLTKTLLDQAKSEKMGNFVEGLREKAKIKQPGAPDAPEGGAAPAAPETPKAPAAPEKPEAKTDAAL